MLIDVCGIVEIWDSQVVFIPPDLSNYYTKAEIDALLSNAIPGPGTPPDGFDWVVHNGDYVTDGGEYIMVAL